MLCEAQGCDLAAFGQRLGVDSGEGKVEMDLVGAQSGFT